MPELWATNQCLQTPARGTRFLLDVRSVDGSVGEHGILTSKRFSDGPSVMTAIPTFGQVNFANAQLGDKRRTDRLVKLVDLMTRRPAGTLPQKFNNPKDLKAFYRLMNREEVNHEAMLAPHRAATWDKIKQIRGPVLILHDATELDFTSHRSLGEGVGQIGNGSRRGYLAQNSLAVAANTRQVLGLCNQVLHRRATVSKNESTSQKRDRFSRESRLWLRGADQCGNHAKLIDVCDQGADTFEFLESECGSGRRFVIRAAYDRSIELSHDENSRETSYLRTYARTLQAAGHWRLWVTSKVETKRPKKKGKKKTMKRISREAKMAVAFAPVKIKPPQTKRGNHGDQPLSIWIIRVWETDPPAGQERLEWFLMTNEPVEDFEDAYRVVQWYECRWIVEEYHKGMKTGCSIESPQFTSEDRLQPAIALISIVTLTLLQMRDISRRRDAKKLAATDFISEDYVHVLSGWRHGKIQRAWSIHEFFYALARLGGHQNRKSDHPPGWQIIWRGWNDLQAMVCGYDAMKNLKQCG